MNKKIIIKLNGVTIMNLDSANMVCDVFADREILNIYADTDTPYSNKIGHYSSRRYK